MPAPSPGLFGRFGTAGRLEKETRQAEKFASAIEEAEQAIKDMYGAQAKGSAATKKAHAEAAAAVAMVSKELKGTTVSAKNYGKAVQKDAKAVLDFAKKHKVSLKEATAMYSKLKKEQSLFSQGLQKGMEALNRYKGLAGFMATGAAAMKEYRKRLDEIHTGHQLLLSDTAITQKGFKDTQKYIDGYRDAVRSARDITAKYGVAAEEVKQTTRALAFSLRGQIKDISKLGPILKEDTDRLYGFAKAMNVDAATALTFFRNQMRVQGKTHEQARKSLDTVIAGYDQMKVKVGDAAAPLKEEYLATLQQIRQELGPSQVSTASMTAAMNMLAESAKKAGLSAKGITDTMAAAPKLLKGLPKFYRMQIGGGILAAMRANNAQFQALAKQHPKIAKQLKTLASTDMPIWRKQEIAQQLTEGTAMGMSGVLKKLKQVGPALRSQYYQNMGLTGQQIVAIESGLKTGELSAKKLSELTKGVQKGQKKATDTRQTMHESLKKNTKGVDNLALKTFGLEQKVKGLIDQYSTYVTPALGALTLAMNAGNLVQGLRGLTGGLSQAGGALGKLTGAAGGVAGKAGAAGALIAAATAGWQFGKWLDKKFGISDKISDWAFKQDKELLSKMERMKRSRGHAQQTVKAADAYMKRFEQLRKKGITSIKERYSTKGLKPGQKGYAASERVRERKLTAEMFKKLTYKRLDLEGEVKRGTMTKQQAAIIKAMVEKRAKAFESIKPAEKKTVEAKKEGEKQRAKAERRARVGEAALKSTAPAKRRVTTGPPTPTAPQSQTPGTGAGAQPGATEQSSQYDPAMGTFTTNVTLSSNDPNFMNFMKQNQSILNQDKRGR
ncbi:MAG: hypothetical protein GWN58_23390 [Anaerolineae bacterium]|nr:hypothetical protein [Thermoplasmata archaeon]NIV32275.1 hypothetical protein [Anaerolineae bacterium]NIY03728.1 hypothetical protein [Thermoplasmata archaeon]